MSDLIYGSARVRAGENSLIGSSRLSVLIEEASLSDIWRHLAEYGLEPIRGSDGEILREKTLSAHLRRAYDLIRECFPDDGAVLLWLYPYDCNNIKAAIKAHVRSVDPQPMMFDFGTIDSEAVISAIASDDFLAFPENMASAAKKAREVFAKTGDPQCIDLLLDRACYQDMLAGAKGFSFIVSLVQAKIDLTNIVTAVRVMRMGGTLRAEEVFLTDGTLEIDFFLSVLERGEALLWQLLRTTAYSVLAETLDEGSALTAVERAADNAWMALLRDVKFIPYGIEVPTAYLLATECEVRNLRILLSGRAAGLSTERIRERIRDGYV